MRLTASNVRGERGHVAAVIKALDLDDSVLYQDSLLLDKADARHRFAVELAGKLDTSRPENRAEAIEAQLLKLFLEVEATVKQTTGADDLISALFGKQPSTSERLLELAKDAELFHDEGGEVYATFTVNGHAETWPVESRGFRDWLVGRYYAQHEAAPNAPALKDALGALRARGRFEGPERPVHLRVAEYGGATYIDLADDAWRCVEVTASGWRVLPAAPRRFRRALGSRPLPVPEPGGSLEHLREYVNLPDDTSWRLFLTWLLATLRPSGPYVILVLVGEQGAAKSTLLRVGRRLVDPNKTEIRSRPSEDRDIAIQASSNWWLTYDNLSQMPEWLSDILCTVATGGGFGTRALYTNDEEQLFDYQRPVALNAIAALTLRGDFTDRALVLEVPNLSKTNRRAERAFWAAFERDRPALFGALLDALVVGLANEGTVAVPELPRMADFALFGAQVAPAVGWTAEQFLRAYDEHREHANATVLEASPLVEPLRDVLAVDPCWVGTATALLARLNEVADKDAKRHRDWPKDATRLSGELRRLAPVLRGEGIPIAFGYGKGGKTRLILLGAPPEPERPDTDPATEDRGRAASSASLPSDEPRRDAKSEASADDANAPGSVVRVASGVVGSVVAPDDTDPADATNDAPPAPADAVPLLSVVGALSRNGAGTPFPAADDANDANDAARRLSSTAAVVSASAAPYTVLTTPADVAAALPALLAAPALGLDCETLGLDPLRDRVRLVQLATPDCVYMLDGFQCAPRALAPVLSQARRLVGHNLKFDLRMLAAAGLPVPEGARLFDAQLAAQVLGAGTADGYLNRCGLAAVAARCLGVSVDKTEQRSDWSGPLTPAQLAYAARDAAILLPLAARLEADLAAAGLEMVAALEMGALPALIWLEQTGAPFDAEAWADLSDGAVAEQVQLEAALTAEAGAGDLFGRGTINWGSPPQVLAVLRGRGHALERTDEPSLQALAAREPLARLLVAYREASRKAGVYGIEFVQKWVHPTTGRIHADYLQLGSVAGRMSCQRPNLQNIPRDPAYRACFRAPEGRLLVKADYSQIELRIAAELTGDPRMLAAYQRGEDLHAVTAAAVLGRSGGAVRPEDRQAAKALNFGLLYGMGADTLREHAATNYGVQLTEAEARAFRERYFAAYAGLRRWHRSQPEGAVETRTPAGRRRLAVGRFTEKLNTPVQGTGADGLKAALACLWETRDRCRSAAPVLCVHDEIVVECDAEAADQARAWLVDAMRAGMAPYLPRVPVEVEAKTGRDWSMTT